MLLKPKYLRNCFKLKGKSARIKTKVKHPSLEFSSGTGYFHCPYCIESLTGNEIKQNVNSTTSLSWYTMYLPFETITESWSLQGTYSKDLYLAQIFAQVLFCFLQLWGLDFLVATDLGIPTERQSGGYKICGVRKKEGCPRGGGSWDEQQG